MTDLCTTILLTLALLHVSVAQEPSLELLPSNILKPLGDGVYISCTANVDDPGLVTEMTWTGPNGERIPNADGTINTLEGIGGPGKLDLMIQNLREQDTGIYNCTATYAGNQKLSAGLAVEAYMDIHFGDTPVHQTPFINTEYKIRCTPVAKPAPQVDWLKDLVPLKNNENYIIQQDGVLIKRVTEADEGIYRCRARVPELGSIEYRDIQVEVFIPPRIENPPKDTKGVEKDSVTFHCGAIGKPAPSYSWVNKDNEPLKEKEDYFIDSDKGILTIMALRPEHSGVYRCTAKNPAGEDHASAQLQVLTKPKVEQYLNITNAVDDEAEMRCIATGDPLPEIVFRKETNNHPFQNGINEDDRIEVQQTTDDQGRRVGILKIRGVIRSDDGLYTCTASSEGGDTQVWGHITVEFKPSFEEQLYKELWSWKQQPVNLTCLATSIPNATIQWYLRNEEISANDQNLQVLSISPLGVLRVNPVTTSYFGDYTCEATNRLGIAKMSLELKEAHAPGPISNAKVEKKTATTVTWSIIDPMDDGGLPIQGYVVEYRLQDLSWDDSKSSYWTKGSSYTLDGLKPQETYIFRFAARSEVGDGEWSSEKSELMPRRAAPEEPLIFNVDKPVTEIPYPDQYRLHWQVPLDNGEKIDFFQIIYYQVHNVSGTWENAGTKTTRQVEHPGETTYTIENLRSNSYYRIELRAHNEIGFSTPAEAVIKTANDPSAVTGPNAEEAMKSDLGIGIIVAIVVIAVLIIAVVVDVTCFCTNNAGLTAAVLRKRGAKDKDKEAMLEDGKNASADTLNEESTDETKTIDEKPIPEKELQKPSEKKVETKSEKETDDILEENGQMKPQKEDGIKPEQQAPEEKIKDTTEPTETTPMIQGQDVSDKNRGVLACPQNVLTEQDKRQANEQLQLLAIRNSNNIRIQTTQPRIVNVFPKKNAKQKDAYGLNSQPLNIAMALENPMNKSGLKKNSKSTPILDKSISEDSIYAVPLQDQVTYGQQPSNAKHLSSEVKTKPPPPPPRNPDTSLAVRHRSRSQEILSGNHQNQQINKDALIHEHEGYYASGRMGANFQGSRRPFYLSSSREALNQGSYSPYISKSKESLYQEAENPYYMSLSRNELNESSASSFQMSANRKAQKQNVTNHSANRSTLDQEIRNPYYEVISKEALNKEENPYYMPECSEEFNTGPRNPYYIPESREFLTQDSEMPYQMSSSREALNQEYRAHNERTKHLHMLANEEALNQRPRNVQNMNRSPSESSSSTLYQPLNTSQNQAKTRVAYEIAPYDDPVSMSSTSKHIDTVSVSQQRKYQVPPPHVLSGISPAVSINRPTVLPPSIPIESFSIPSPLTSKIPLALPALQKLNDNGSPLKTVTKVYLRDNSKPPSHSQSMDNLDEAHNSSSARGISSFSPASITSAKSLGSLIQSTPGLRSYGQPTHI
nr:fasciclin-2-like isoform X2 [Cherax quadricarinatus]